MSMLLMLLLAASLAVVDLETTSLGVLALVWFVFLVNSTVALVLGLFGWRRKHDGCKKIATRLLAALFLFWIVVVGVSKRQEAVSRERGDAICVALEEFHRQTGSYPAQLHALVSEYLPNIPTSDCGVFVKRPFGYACSKNDDYRLDFLAHTLTFWERSARRPWWSD